MTERPRTDISVVVPTHGRPDALAACLRALAASDYEPAAFEVIVVDDGGSADLENLLGEFARRLRLRLIVQARTGPATARNHGAALARGEFLAFTDDDCLPAPDWLSTAVHSLRELPRALIGGRVKNALPDNIYATASQQLVSYLYEYHSRTGRQAFFTSNNMVVARQAFLDSGGFDGGFPLAAGEDREFGARWQRQGGVMRFEPALVVLHAHALGPLGYARQHYNYGRGAWHYHSVRHRQEREHRHLPEPLGFYTDLLRHPLRSGEGGISHAALLFVSQLANAVGYFRERLRPHRPEPRSALRARRTEPIMNSAAGEP